MARSFAVVAIAGLSLCACGTGSSSTDAAANPDVGAAPMDLAVLRDLTALAPTGDPCTKDTDCAASLGGPNPKGKCVKSTTNNGMTIPWTGGYCQSPCRPSKGDVQTGLNNTDCPSDTAVCSPTSQTAGVCVTGCQTVGDCRDEYVCASNTGVRTAGCVPIAESGCDPVNDPRPQNLKCPMGQRCNGFSPDASYGRCADICDPATQNCAPPQSGTNGCIVDYTANDGTGNCINVGTVVEGGDCGFRNDCLAGMQCFSGKCRQYCRQVGNDPPTPACPMGETCQDLKVSGLTIKFKKDVLGLCQ